MIVRWKTAQRRRHVIRLLLALAAIPCLIGIQQAALWWVYLPALGRQKLAEFNAARAEQLAATSLVYVGDPAPQFSLTTAEGAEFSMADAAGDVVVINFFATWCGPCQVELPHIQQIWDARRTDDHFRLLVIGREETNDSVRQFRDEKGFSFPIAADPDRTVYSLFAEESIPRTLVVSPDGVIVYSKAGFMEEDLDELNAVLEEQLAL
jgi:peroxiredoxin